MNKLNITINFDMDGTIADLYGVDNWLEMLIAEDTTPYAEAEPLLRLCSLARVLNRLQRNGYELAEKASAERQLGQNHDCSLWHSKTEFLRNSVRHSV